MKNYSKVIAVAFAFVALGSFANPAVAAITIYFSPGATCNSAAARSSTSVGRIAPGNTNPMVSVCMTATIESVCGVTLFLESGAPNESWLFQVVARKSGTIFPDANLDSARTAVALKHPVSREDFGGIRPEPAKPFPPAADQLLTTFTLAPLATAKAGSYSIRVATGSMAAVAIGGGCEYAEEVPISGAFVLDRS